MTAFWLLLLLPCLCSGQAAAQEKVFPHWCTIRPNETFCLASGTECGCMWCERSGCLEFRVSLDSAKAHYAPLCRWNQLECEFSHCVWLGQDSNMMWMTFSFCGAILCIIMALFAQIMIAARRDAFRKKHDIDAEDFETDDDSESNKKDDDAASPTLKRPMRALGRDDNKSTSLLVAIRWLLVIGFFVCLLIAKSYLEAFLLVRERCVLLHPDAFSK